MSSHRSRSHTVGLSAVALAGLLGSAQAADGDDNSAAAAEARVQQLRQQLAEQSMSARDRTQTAAWRTLTESGALAGEVARTVANEAATLRQEFRRLLESVG